MNDEELKMEQEFLNKLIDAHWEYIEGFLIAHDEPEDVKTMIEYHYKTAFKHGWKHHKEYDASQKHL